ncbi:hypothetical protein, partial [Ramlibacter sp. 2FC]|uniref:hypothetical protein n=1 Tax=Ramlibacter sp. 2FC TaxID=2502188 RepID=UPI0010F86EA7
MREQPHSAATHGPAPALAAGGQEVSAVRHLGEVLARAPAYHALDAGARRELDRSLTRIQQVLGPAMRGPLARQMAPDLRSQLAPGGSPAPAPAGAS